MLFAGKGLADCTRGIRLTRWRVIGRKWEPETGIGPFRPVLAFALYYVARSRVQAKTDVSPKATMVGMET